MRKRFIKHLEERVVGLRLLVFDFDGVFTDGKVIVREDGKESVVCSRKDTLRLPELVQAGIRLVVISKEGNPVVAARCQKIKVGSEGKLECFQGVDDKLTLLQRFLDQSGITASETAFMGDDINDLPCMKHVGLSFTVADGHFQCKQVADYTTARKGGDHAVREVCDLILEIRNLADFKKRETEQGAGSAAV